MEVREVLDRLVEGARTVLEDDLVGAYLVGSFALGAADAASDVDFLVVVRDVPTAAQEVGLRALHARLPDLPPPWAQHLEGSYAPVAQLRPPPVPGEGWLYVDNGARSMESSTHDNSLVVRWIAREHGITLVGPPARELVDPVTAEQLGSDARTVLARWDADVRARPGQFADLLAQQQHVLGLCRLLHRLRYGRVVSKQTAARWFTSSHEGRWGALVDAAVAGRTRAWDRVGAVTPHEVQVATLEFHRHVVELARN